MNEETIEKQIADPVVAVVIPTFNNASTIAEVVEEVKKFSTDVIVVNDGSTDSTAEIVKKINGIEVINFPENLGKGYALRAGFKKSAERGFSHVISIDGDGQHLAKEIPVFVKKIKEQPDAIWIGNRTLPYEKGEEPPARSSFGRKFGNFWYRFNTGIRLHDTQCGFRAYPVNAVLSLKCKGKRYEYEQEVLIKSAWNGIAVREVPVRLFYLPEEKTVSHFRPVRDFLRISRINSRAAITRIFLPVTALEAPGATWRDKIVALAKHEIKANTTPKRAAASVAAGVFMGIFPIHGFQVVTLMGFSFLLRLNRPLAFLGVSVSSAPFMPFIIVITIAIGRLVLPADLITLDSQKTAQMLAQGAVEFVVGSIILSVIAGIAAYFITLPMFKQLAKIRLFKNRARIHDI